MFLGSKVRPVLKADNLTAIAPLFYFVTTPLFWFQPVIASLFYSVTTPLFQTYHDTNVPAHHNTNILVPARDRTTVLFRLNTNVPAHHNTNILVPARDSTTVLFRHDTIVPNPSQHQCSSPS
jgi:hypothetical protein